MEKYFSFKNSLMNKTKGITLIELIVALALLSIVFSVIFSFNIFGVRVFGKGDTLSGIQYDVRMASDFIFSEVRNSSEVFLSVPAVPDDYNKIYIEDNKIKYKPAGSPSVDKTNAIIKNPNTDVLFSLVKNGSSYMLEFTIFGTDDGNAFSLSTDVLLNNIRSATLITNQHAIYYKKVEITATAVPTASPTPSPTPTTTPIPLPTNTPTPAPIPDSPVKIIYDSMTNISVKIEFINNINSYSIPSESNFTIVHNIGENFLTLNLPSGSSYNKNYIFSIVNVFGITKNVTVHFKNDTQLWDVVQLSE